MTHNAPKTVEEELAELELLGAEAPAAPPPKKGSKAPRQKLTQEDDALKGLEELEDLGKFQRPEGLRPTSRPNTPKLSSSSTASSNRRGADVATPSSTGSARTSEDRAAAPRKSGESTRSFHQSFAPTQEEPAKEAPEPKAEAAAPSGSSWWGGGWGGILNTATEAANAAKKQAEAAYQELQKNQEAQRWAEQVRGNVGALRGMGTTTLRLEQYLDVLTRYRGRIEQARNAHLYQHPAHHCSTDCATRTAADTHHSRPHRISLARPNNPPDLLQRHGPG